MFQFPGFAPTIVGTGSSTQWVPPFGDARINSCLQIPEPYRSLPRPSSPPDSLGILRSLLSSFAECMCESHNNFYALAYWNCSPKIPFLITLFIRLTLSFALPLVISLSIIKELCSCGQKGRKKSRSVSNGTAKVEIIFRLAKIFLNFFAFIFELPFWPLGWLH